MMTVDEVLAGDWKLLVGEMPAELATELTFDCGVLREDSVAVGSYQVEGSRLNATIGGDVRVVVTLPDLSPLLPHIEAVKPNLLSAVMRTRIPDDADFPGMDGDELVEAATLVRVTH